MDEGRGRHRNRGPRRAWRSGRQDGGWARLDAGVDEVLDLIDVGLGGGVERYGVAVGHFLGNVTTSTKYILVHIKFKWGVEENEMRI